jgi:adenylate cyclase
MLWAALAAALVWLLVERRRARHARLARESLEQRLAVATRSLESLQQSFARFVPAEVVETIIAHGVSTRSEKKEVTVLFADLKAFTALSDELDPALLVRMLNGYFERMSRAISNHRGHVAKFIGDGLLAFFGVLEPNPWQSADAVHAALAMRDALADYNLALKAEGAPPLAMGVGIHRGVAVAGVIGSAELVEYGVIGATVNLASRVEELTRVHAVEILITDAVRTGLDARFRLCPMPPVNVKGFSTPVPTFAVEGFVTERETPPDGRDKRRS